MCCYCKKLPVNPIWEPNFSSSSTQGALIALVEPSFIRFSAGNVVRLCQFNAFLCVMENSHLPFLCCTVTADCLNCSDERKICFNLCGNDQKCVNNCNQVFSDCLTSNTINNCNSVRRFLLRDVAEENDKNPELQPDYETLFKAVNWVLNLTETTENEDESEIPVKWTRNTDWVPLNAIANCNTQLSYFFRVKVAIKKFIKPG